MDECSSGTYDCPGQCVNTDGSYTCNCTGISGYQSGVNRPCKGKCPIGNSKFTRTKLDIACFYK